MVHAEGESEMSSRAFLYMNESGDRRTYLDLDLPAGWRRQYDLLPEGVVWRRITKSDLALLMRGKRKLDLSKRVKFDKTDTGMSQYACLQGRV